MRLGKTEMSQLFALLIASTRQVEKAYSIRGFGKAFKSFVETPACFGGVFPRLSFSRHTAPRFGRLRRRRRRVVTSNFESTYFSKGKSTDFRNVKSTPSLKNEKASITL